jgi:hypothetical protein
VLAGQDNATWPLPGVAFKLAGAARLTSSVVDAVWVSEPLLPVIVSESA